MEVEVERWKETVACREGRRWEKMKRKRKGAQQRVKLGHKGGSG